MSTKERASETVGPKSLNVLIRKKENDRIERENQAFAKRLGIPLELCTTDMIIFVPCEGVVKVIHEYNADENSIETFQRIRDENRKEVEKEFQAWKAERGLA